MEKIPSDQVESKKKIGRNGNRGVWSVKTRGGLYLVAEDGGKVLGTGPHPAVARFLAQKFEPDVEYTELSKGEHYDIDVFQHLIPKYEEITARMRKLQE